MPEPRIYELVIADDCTLDLAAETAEKAVTLASWLLDEPVATGSPRLREMTLERWLHATGLEEYDAVAEHLHTLNHLQKACRKAQADYRHWRARANAAMTPIGSDAPRPTIDQIDQIDASHLYGRQAVLDLQKALRLMGIRGRLQERLTRLMGEEHRTAERRLSVSYRPGKDEIGTADGFARRTTEEVLIAAIDAALDEFGHVSPATDGAQTSASVNRAYAALYGARWHHFYTVPDELVLLRNQVRWLSDVARLAFHKSFDIKVGDEHLVTSLHKDKLDRPISAGEIRCAINGRAPIFLDRQIAQQASPWFDGAPLPDDPEALRALLAERASRLAHDLTALPISDAQRLKDLAHDLDALLLALSDTPSNPNIPT